MTTLRFDNSLERLKELTETDDTHDRIYYKEKKQVRTRQRNIHRVRFGKFPNVMHPSFSEYVIHPELMCNRKHGILSIKEVYLSLVTRVCIGISLHWHD